MCNAHNHSPGCNCGFGGGYRGTSWAAGWRGGLGGIWSGFGGFERVIPHIDSRSFMQQLADELGHSIVFPTICRYCFRPIYLFAARNGGFAIFDHLGPPWPKHECYGIQQNVARYVILDVARFGRISVPADTEFRAWQPGTSFEGLVAEYRAGMREIDVFTGQERITEIPVLDGHVRAGAYVTCSGGAEHGGASVEVVELPDVLPTTAPAPAAPPLEDSNPAVEGLDARVHAYRLDQAALQAHGQCAAHRLLDGLVEASSSGFPLTELMLLLELLTLKNTPIATEVRARQALDAFDLARKLGFDSLPASTESSLSKGVRQKLRAIEADDGMEQGLRSLHAKFHVRDTSRSRFRILRKQEQKFFDELCAKLESIDVRAMVRRFEQKLSQNGQ